MDFPPPVESFNKTTRRFYGHGGVIPIHPFSFLPNQKAGVFFELIRFPIQAAYRFKKVHSSFPDLFLVVGPPSPGENTRSVPNHSLLGKNCLVVCSVFGATTLHGLAVKPFPREVWINKPKAPDIRKDVDTFRSAPRFQGTCERLKCPTS